MFIAGRFSGKSVLGAQAPCNLITGPELRHHQNELCQLCFSFQPRLPSPLFFPLPRACLCVRNGLPLKLDFRKSSFDETEIFKPDSSTPRIRLDCAWYQNRPHFPAVQIDLMDRLESVSRHWFLSFLLFSASFRIVFIFVSYLGFG